MHITALRLTALLGVGAILAAGCDSGRVTAGAEQESPGESSTNEAPPKAIDEAPATSQLLDKTFDDIKFDIEPGDPFAREMLTPEIESLDGKSIRIRGYILPTAQKKGLKEFVLVRDNLECCFGPGAALYDCILVQMASGTTAQFVPYPVTVTGEFTIKELKLPDGTPLAIYRMKGEEVE